MERFEIHRIKDFKANMIRYIEDQMAHQQQVRLKKNYLYTSKQTHLLFFFLRSLPIGSHLYLVLMKLSKI